MCNACMMEGFDCGVPGMDCLTYEVYDEQPVPYHSTLGGTAAGCVNYVGSLESKNMSDTTVEVAVDDNGIITKQSEVYVWNDQVFASYKSALAASKKSKIYTTLIKANAARHYPTYTTAQVENLIKTWSKSPASYSITLDVCFDAFVELLAE